MVMGYNDDKPLKRTFKKRRLSRTGGDLPDFFSFPSPADQSIPSQPFRDSVRSFLSRHARLTLPPSLFPSLLTWRVALRLEDPDLSPAVVVLDVVEEDVTRSKRSVYCDHCRVVGWSGHPVCRKRYHFIIRSDSENSCERACSSMLLQQQPHHEDKIYTHKSSSASLLEFSESRCKCSAKEKNKKIRRCKCCADDVEDWVYLQLEDNTHLLHAVVHSNGFGHLLILNGRQGGSNVLSGRQIMGFWDRLCRTLSVRKVSVMDVSKKYGMEYRLVHSVTAGHSWYGEWGYGFGSGSYALTQEAYSDAVDTLSSLPLSPVIFHGRGPRTRLQSVIAFYQSLSMAELVTIKDLFSFLLNLIRETRKLKSSTKPEFATCNVLCPWTRDDVESVQRAMIKVLMAAGGEVSWVTRRALKGALWSRTTSLELLDYCLKHFGGMLAVDGMVVRVRYKPTSNDVEYRLESVTNWGSVMDSDAYPSEEQIVCDLKFLYESLLHPDTMVSFRSYVMRDKIIDSARKVLDSKQFMKVYMDDKMTVENPNAIHLWCHVELSEESKDDLVVPSELIVLPLNATLGDLKTETTKAFQEVYAMFKRFQADELVHFGPIKDSLTLNLLVGSGGSIRVEGRCPTKYGLKRYRMERGIENWTVDCTCGAKDDDGERMLACDSCGVWLHTRCVGIDISDAIPVKFVCPRCKSPLHSKCQNVGESVTEAPLDTSCRGRAAMTERVRLSSNLTLTFGVR